MACTGVFQVQIRFRARHIFFWGIKLFPCSGWSCSKTHHWVVKIKSAESGISGYIQCGLGLSASEESRRHWRRRAGAAPCAGSQGSILQPRLQTPQTPAQPPLIPSLHCPVPPAVSQLRVGTSDFPSTLQYFAFAFHEFNFLCFSLFLQFIKITFLSLSLRDFPASCQLHVQQWLLFSNYSLCKKQHHCHW